MSGHLQTLKSDIHDRRLANLSRLLNPRSIAVVGASADPSKAGSQALGSLSGFPGRLLGVHPREKAIQCVPCVPRIADLPEAVDLAILAIPAHACVQAAAEAAERGIGGLFIISGGFGETGADGAMLQEQLAEICARTGLRLLGPNTSGFINPHAQCVASFVPGVDRLAKGEIAVVAQSGGVNLSLSFLIDRLGDGISLAVGLGNAVDVKTADVLAMLADDPHTKAIALHLEGVTVGRDLYETLRRVTPRKPVVALVAGRSDIGEFAVSHTGNLMGSRQRTVAALIQAGAVVVDTTEDLAQAASILARRRLPPRHGNNVALITGQAGPGLLIADSLKAAGVAMPALSDETVEKIGALLPPMTFIRNPVDTGRPASTFPQIVRLVAQDPGIDAILVFGLSEPSVLDPAEALVPAADSTGKPVIFGTLGIGGDFEASVAAMRAQDLPTALGPERLALAAIVLDADSRGQWRLGHASGPAALLRGTELAGTFDEDRAKALLRSYGIPAPQRVLCASRGDALAAFRRLRRPVAVKIAAADIAHKTEVGGVILDVRDEAALEEALDRIAAIPTAEPGRVLIEEMAPPGVEMIVGGVRDPSWGPVVVVGIGGILAEALSDTAMRLAPVGRIEALDMLNGLRAGAVLDGFRHLPRCDREAIAESIMAVGRLLEDHPEVAEVEINPLRVYAEGVLALDALVVGALGKCAPLPQSASLDAQASPAPRATT